jgi:PAS domain-containing protein
MQVQSFTTPFTCLYMRHGQPTAHLRGQPSATQASRLPVYDEGPIESARVRVIAGLVIQRRRRRRAEASHRESEQHFRMMADTTPVMVWRTGPDKRRDFVSKPWLVFGGRTLEEERGTGWIEGVHPEDRGYCLLSRAGQGETVSLTGEASRRAKGLARSVHDLSHGLHPNRLRLLGLVSALEALRNEFSECEMEIEFAHENIPSTLPADVTLCLFRIVQEGLHVIAGKAQNGTAALEAARRTSAPSARLRDPLTIAFCASVGAGFVGRFDAPGQRSERLPEPGRLGTEPHQGILGEPRDGRLLSRRQQTCAQFTTELQALELKAVRLMKGCYVSACCR